MFFPYRAPVEPQKNFNFQSSLTRASTGTNRMVRAVLLPTSKRFQTKSTFELRTFKHEDKWEIDDAKEDDDDDNDIYINHTGSAWAKEMQANFLMDL